MDACTGEYRLPVDQLGRARLAVPRPSLRALRLELEQVAAERPVEAGDRGLGAVGGAPERGLAPSRRARLGVPSRPALEQAAEGECRDFAGVQLDDQVPDRGVVDAVLGERLAPVGPPDAQTSITTGRIIGRRLVRS
jgi:hypothetical protein